MNDSKTSRAHRIGRTVSAVAALCVGMLAFAGPSFDGHETTDPVMITDAILHLLQRLLELIDSVLPLGTITGLPSATAFGDKIGAMAGPFNQIIPLAEMVTVTVIFVTVWMPAALVYQLTFWIYKHLPFIGKG